MEKIMKQKENSDIVMENRFAKEKEQKLKDLEKMKEMQKKILKAVKECDLNREVPKPTAADFPPLAKTIELNEDKVKITEFPKKDKKEEPEEGEIVVKPELSKTAELHNQKLEVAKEVIKKAVGTEDARIKIQTTLEENSNNPALQEAVSKALNDDIVVSKQKITFWYIVKSILNLILKKVIYGPGVGARFSPKELLGMLISNIRTAVSNVKNAQIRKISIKLIHRLLSTPIVASILSKLYKCYTNQIEIKFPTIRKPNLTLPKPSMQLIKTAFNNAPRPSIRSALSTIKLFSLIKVFKKFTSIPLISNILQALRITRQTTEVCLYVGSSTMTLLNTIGYIDSLLGMFTAPSNITVPQIDYEGISETDLKPCILLKDAANDPVNPYPYVQKTALGDYKVSVLYSNKTNPVPIQQLNVAIPQVAAIGIPSNVHMAGNPLFPTYSLVDKYELVKAENLTLKRTVIGYYHWIKYLLARSMVFRVAAIPLMVYTRNFSYLYSWYTTLRDATYHRNKAISSFYNIVVTSQYIDESLYSQLRQPVFLDTNLPVHTMKGAGSAQISNASRGIYHNDTVEVIYRTCRDATVGLRNPLPERNVVHQNTFRMYIATSLATMHRKETTASSTRVLSA